MVYFWQVSCAPFCAPFTQKDTLNGFKSLKEFRRKLEITSFDDSAL